MLLVHDLPSVGGVDVNGEILQAGDGSETRAQTACYSNTDGNPSGTRLAGHPWVPAEYFGIVHLGMGNIDSALGFFEQAYREKSGAMVFLHVDPMLDPLIDHPRWDALIASVGIAKN